MNLTEKQLATILVALRYWQANYDEELHEIFADHFTKVAPLTGAEIDELYDNLDDGKNDKFFAITHLHREDVIAAGYDGVSLSDGEMENIADKLGDDYLSQLFHDSLRIILQYADVPKLRPEVSFVKLESGLAWCIVPDFPEAISQGSE